VSRRVDYEELVLQTAPITDRKATVCQARSQVLKFGDQIDFEGGNEFFNYVYNQFSGNNKILMSYWSRMQPPWLWACSAASGNRQHIIKIIAICACVRIRTQKKPQKEQLKLPCACGSGSVSRSTRCITVVFPTGSFRAEIHTIILLNKWPFAHRILDH